MNKTKYDILIIGAGPAGIFSALELKKRFPALSIALVDQGRLLGERKCPKHITGKCVSCKPHCHITSGFSGAGAFSDGKLSLSHEVGGDLPDLIGKQTAQSLIEYADSLYLGFGADTRVEGAEDSAAKHAIKQRAEAAQLRLVDCPIRHMGTEKAHDIYYRIQQYLIQLGVEVVGKADCTDLIIQPIVKGKSATKAVNLHETDKLFCDSADGSLTNSDSANSANSGSTNSEKEINGKRCVGAVIGGEKIFADRVVVATGRKGAGWLAQMCKKHDIASEVGTVDIGVRVEVKNEVMEEINSALYEGKLIGYPLPFKNKVRTFCQNPGGFVSQENYDDNLALVNGHSYKDKKSDNTNLAILCSHRFLVPFNQPILYAQKVGQLMNMLGGGSILVQRLGDIKRGKRTWRHELDENPLRPTLPDAEPGDITSALPYRTMISILGFIEQVEKVAPGFAADEMLLYAPEIKLYSNRIVMDKELNTSVEGLYCLGDSSGWTRGLMMASVMGIYLAQTLIL